MSDHTDAAPPVSYTPGPGMACLLREARRAVAHVHRAEHDAYRAGTVPAHYVAYHRAMDKQIAIRQIALWALSAEMRAAHPNDSNTDWQHMATAALDQFVNEPQKFAGSVDVEGPTDPDAPLEPRPDYVPEWISTGVGGVENYHLAMRWETPTGRVEVEGDVWPVDQFDPVVPDTPVRLRATGGDAEGWIALDTPQARGMASALGAIAIRPSS